MKMKKSVILGAALAGALMLQACSSKPAETPTTAGATTEAATTAGNADEAAGAGAYKAGTYTATAKGFGGDVTVTITVDETKITDVKIEGADETEDYGGKAIDALPDAIKEAQSADVDAVATATVTSDAIKTAAADALSQAAAE